MDSNQAQPEQQEKLALRGRETIAEPIERVLGMFREELKGVRFPDVSLEVLESAVGVVQEKAAELEALRLSIAVAEAGLREQQDALRALAERGLAYAKVYAEARPELATTLEGIRLRDEAPRKARKVRKARRAKGDEQIVPPEMHLVAVS